MMDTGFNDDMLLGCRARAQGRCLASPPSSLTIAVSKDTKIEKSRSKMATNAADSKVDNRSFVDALILK